MKIIETKYKLGEIVYISPKNKNEKPYIDIISTIGIRNGELLYNYAYNENEISIAKTIGNIKCNDMQCKNCPLTNINCSVTTDTYKTVYETYEKWCEVTGYKIPKLEEELNKPYENNE